MAVCLLVFHYVKKTVKWGHTRRVGILELVLEGLPLTQGEGLDESQGLGKLGQHEFSPTNPSFSFRRTTHILARDGVDNVIRGGFPKAP